MFDRALRGAGVLAACVALLAAIGLLVAVLAGLGEASGRQVPPSPPVTVIRAAEPTVPAAANRPPTGRPRPAEPKPSARPKAGDGPIFRIVAIRPGRSVPMLASPDGPELARVGPRTEFGSRTELSVVATRPGWLGVSSPDLEAGQLGWIRRDPSRVELFYTRYWLRVSLSRRTLEVRYGSRTVSSFAVTIGGVGTETPPGRYGVTDAIVFRSSPYYGCCALALSGHQTSPLPADWIGGNRLAIHGTEGAVGLAESLGCVRATDETMRFLFAHVPLGTPVFVDA